MTERFVFFVLLSLCLSCGATEPNYVVGSLNPDLSEGARLLQVGKDEEGIRRTLLGLESATNKRDEEAALSNLCAGYTNLGDYQTALKYCDIVLTRNDKAWRAYNSKAFIYIATKQYEKAEAALLKGEAINAGARSMKIARALYLDATQPVEPAIEIDDRRRQENQ
ncbi:MAG: hypothetical protein ACR2QR_11875 [Woeseiaceae bacterium]